MIITDLIKLYLKKLNNTEFKIIKNEFDKENREVSIRKGRKISVIIIITEIVMISISYNKKYLLLYGTYLNYYRLLYFILIIASVLMLSLFSLINRKIIKKDSIIKAIFILDASGGLIWGATVTILDIIQGRDSLVYITLVLLVPLGIYIKPITLVVLYVSVQSYFCMFIQILSISNEDKYSTIINTGIFIIFAICINQVIYNNKIDIFTKQKIIESKNNELKKMNQKLEQISGVDYLTGLYNRRKLSDILSSEWEKAIANNNIITIIMVDIDCFKGYNDTYGHVAGDQCIKAIADILIQFCSNKSAYAARYGGDEFCLILNGYKDYEVEMFIQELKNDVLFLKMKNVKSVKSEYITISCGFFADEIVKYSNAWELIGKADENLYANKKNSKKHYNYI